MPMTALVRSYRPFKQRLSAHRRCRAELFRPQRAAQKSSPSSPTLPLQPQHRRRARPRPARTSGLRRPNSTLPMPRPRMASMDSIRIAGRRCSMRHHTPQRRPAQQAASVAEASCPVSEARAEVCQAQASSKHRAKQALKMQPRCQHRAAGPSSTTRLQSKKKGRTFRLRERSCSHTRPWRHQVPYNKHLVWWHAALPCSRRLLRTRSSSKSTRTASMQHP